MDAEEPLEVTEREARLAASPLADDRHAAVLVLRPERQCDAAQEREDDADVRVPAEHRTQRIGIHRSRLTQARPLGWKAP